MERRWRRIWRKGSLPTQVLIDPSSMIIGRYGYSLGEGHEALDKRPEMLFN